MKIASRLWRVLMGLLFLSAGLSKIDSPLRTLADVYAYRIPLPDWLAEGIATSLPWVEILLGALLIVGIWKRIAIAGLLGFLGFFSILTAQAWWRDLPIDCGCLDFSALHPVLSVLESPGGAALRNILFFFVSAALAFLEKKRWSQ